LKFDGRLAAGENDDRPGVDESAGKLSRRPDILQDHIDLHNLPCGQTLVVVDDRKGFAAILKWTDVKGLERMSMNSPAPITGGTAVHGTSFDLHN
jgi:hypothetical protein